MSEEKLEKRVDFPEEPTWRKMQRELGKKYQVCCCLGHQAIEEKRSDYDNNSYPFCMYCFRPVIEQKILED